MIKITAPIYVLVVVIAFMVAYFIMPLVQKLAIKLGAIDEPNARKVHSRPIPRLGGLGIFVSFMLMVIPVTVITGRMEAPLVGILLGATIVFAAGVLDDIYQLSPWTKLLFQVGAATIAIFFGVRVHFMTNPFDGMFQLGMMSIPLTILWIIGVTNAVNLIDGLDGLAAGVSMIAAITIGIVAFRADHFLISFVALVLAGSIAGFLPHNFYPASTFMGDSGAMFLGFVLSCLSITGLAKSAALISLFVPIVILGIPIFDTFFAIIRRVNNRTPIFGADKAHLHHRLMDMGYGHKKSVVIIYIMSAVLGIVAVLLTYVTSPQAMLILAVLIPVIIVGASRIGIVGDRQEKEKASTSGDMMNNINYQRGRDTSV
ncbi:MAG: glycosyltransferase family 4 protein [Chitinophagales bacterium]